MTSYDPTKNMITHASHTAALLYFQHELEREPILKPDSYSMRPANLGSAIACNLSPKVDGVLIGRAELANLVGAPTPQELANAQRRLQLVFVFADRVVFGTTPVGVRSTIMDAYLKALTSRILRARFPLLPSLEQAEAAFNALVGLFNLALESPLPVPWAVVGHQWARWNSDLHGSADAVEAMTEYAMRAAISRTYLTAMALRTNGIPANLS